MSFYLLIEKFGIGIDIVNVDRFSSKVYSKNKEFYSKIFSITEINYCTKFKEPYTHFAGKFALKEAVIKAINKKIPLLDIETFHENGVPQVKLKNQSNYSSISSISHENNVAVAVFLIESSG
jgi:holo-[acyl-carrier protein] synthase|tara:strand:- start:280 stop:645 length:366 start_codon:yes stop_codon:yes gene_type:complete